MESSSSSSKGDVPNSSCIEQDYSPKPQKDFSYILSTLPTSCGWIPSTLFYQYQGFWYPSAVFLEGVLSVQQNFKAQSTDILVCSAPKSGTTWLKALTFAVATRRRFDDSITPLLTSLPHDCIPFLEFDQSKIINNRDPELPFLSTHIPFTSLPTSVEISGCKIIYICREPKDAFVSLWHFMRKLTKKGEKPICIEEAFELFCGGFSSYGPYWDHVLGYWKASLEWPERVMFLKYEEMMRDVESHVKRLAKFMDYPFSLVEEREGVVEKIVKLCSFENLSNLEVNKTGKHRSDSKLSIENNTYFRKAKVGDWENYLTVEMVKLIDQITEQKYCNSGLTFHV